MAVPVNGSVEKPAALDARLLPRRGRARAPTPPPSTPAPFWSQPPAALLAALATTPTGLTSLEAHRRRATRSHHAPRSTPLATLALLAEQFKSPLVLLLLFSAGLSYFLHDSTDALIIGAIVLVSGMLGFWQERGAASAVARLLSMVEVRTTVLRDGRSARVPVAEVVPGDVLLLSAGAVIPGDCRLLESKDFFLDEAALTGESYPVEKSAEPVPADAPLARRSSALFMGTHVVSGTATAVVVDVDSGTELGKISKRLRLRPPETEFERGIRTFGFLLVEITLLMVVAIFAINVYFHRPVLEALMFSLALAVGLTPQLLPAIVSVNLARGARRMAEAKVIVRRLSSIENFGSMDILCSDKTGTLTAGVMSLHAAHDLAGADSARVFEAAYLNAFYQAGFANPLDDAIRARPSPDLGDWRKVDELPYDFIRKRLSVLVARGDVRRLLTKGAVPKVLEVCTRAERPDGSVGDIEEVRAAVQREVEAWAARGYRALAVAARELETAAPLAKQDEAGMTLLGLLLFEDPPKPGVAETLGRLRDLGVQLKVITGDHHLVAAHLAEQLGLDGRSMLTGPELYRMSNEALAVRAASTCVFAEIEPNQKERIILALKKAGHVVGYIGDGINDASAIHAADVGLSVDSAVDVAKEAADMVLLERDLAVLVEGVKLGRVTFANTMKYIFMASSANFGNMFSMAGASLFLPFLPLLPKQILLTNLMTDAPELCIAGDQVDAEAVAAPRRWDIAFIRRFMILFGVLSSAFDYLTFGVLLWLGGGPEVFRSGWFMESVVSAALIVLVVRTRRPFLRSRPARPLVVAALLAGAAAVVLPFSPLAGVLGFGRLPAVFVLAMAVIVGLYVAGAELAKHYFYRHQKNRA